MVFGFVNLLVVLSLLRRRGFLLFVGLLGWLVAGFAGCSFLEDGFGSGGDFARGILFLFGRGCWALFQFFRVV